MVHNVALLHVRCEPGVLSPLTRAEGSYPCDVADAHAMFKLSCSLDDDDGDDRAAATSMLCVVGAGMQLVRVTTVK